MIEKLKQTESLNRMPNNPGMSLQKDSNVCINIAYALTGGMEGSLAFGTKEV
jgi:hypothetical protein